MPAFARRAGGALTEEQVDVVVHGMRARWARAAALGGTAPPPYAATPGDAGRGAAAYATYCASCHGPSGTGGKPAGSIVDRSYLELVSDQGLRTASVGLAGFVGELSTPVHTVMAIGLMYTLPAVIFYLFVQRYVVAGMTAGSVKG